MHGGPMLNKRNKGQCYFLIVFQVIFVSLQVFVFYPCWQRSPGSTIFGVFRKGRSDIAYNDDFEKSPNLGVKDGVENQIQEEGFLPPKQPPVPQNPIQNPPEQPNDEENNNLGNIGVNIKNGVNNMIDNVKKMLPNAKNYPNIAPTQPAPIQNIIPPQSNKNVVGIQGHAQNAGQAIKDGVNNLMNKVQNIIPNPNQQNSPLVQQKPQMQIPEELRQQELALLKNQQNIMFQKQQTKKNKQASLKNTPNYSPSWDSLDSRPLPQWYDDAKIGIFIHWGVYSVPSYVGVGTNGLSEWLWMYWKNQEYVRPQDEYHSERFADFIQRKKGAIDSVQQFMSAHYPPRWRYQDFAKQFTTEMFDANQWADVFAQSGAKYVVLTSKHHDGYAMWPSSKSWNWNAADIGPHRDLVGELGTAVRKAGLHYGLYHSLYEWFNPMYTQDKLNHFNTQEYVQKKLMPELYDLVNRYNPELVWSDGQFEAPCSYWNCTGFLTWLFNQSPVREYVVTNDRWGTDVLCKHGSFLTCKDRYSPEKNQSRKWESCITIDRESWGYRRNAHIDSYYTIEGLIELLAKTVSNGGNLLMNIGPTSFGTIPPIFEERLKQMGSWLKVHGEAIYGTEAWHTRQDPNNKNVYYTSKATAEGPVIYAIILAWPAGDRLVLSSPRPSHLTFAALLTSHPVPGLLWTRGATAQGGPGISITLPRLPPDQLPSTWAWVVRLSNLLNAL